MKPVYVSESTAVGLDGSTLWLEAGTEYAADHPAVKAHPDRFTSDAPDAEVQDAPRPRGRGRA